MTIVIGSRESELAMIQAHHVRNVLVKRYPSIEFVIKGMTTKGDQVLDVALSKIGSKSLFTKELEVALDAGEIDLIVHSLKDLPTTLPPRMALGAVMSREDPRDVCIMNPKFSSYTLATLPPNSIVGSSSVRRIAQLKRKYPHLKFMDVGWDNRITHVIDKDVIFYAVGQGALGIECRENDERVLNIMDALNHPETQLQCTAERAFMSKLEGGCSVPLGVFSNLDDSQLTLHGSVTSVDGTQHVSDHLQVTLTGDHSSRLEIAKSLGTALAQKLIEQGAKAILDAIKH